MIIFFKSLSLLTVLSLSFFNGYAQNLPPFLGDTWLIQNRGLKVGDKMPDIILGDISNNYTKKIRFSDFKGKLVILDFWNTTCTSCINFFPKMEELQKHFGDKIQIFLVNVSEDENAIAERFEQKNSLLKSGKKVFLPNLPSITQAKELKKLFPFRFVPHHVWIDGEGIIRLIGPSVNTYQKKISELLSGKTIGYIKGANTNPSFNPDIPYWKISNEKFNPKNYNSFIRSFDNSYSSHEGGSVRNVIDTAQNTIRNTWINVTVWDLYQAAFQQRLKSSISNVIYNNLFEYNSMLYVRDTLKYTDQFLSRKSSNFQLTDSTYIKSRVCYEQIAPSTFSTGQLSANMLQDLNNYFGKLYGTKVSIEKRESDCWIIIRKSTIDKLSSKHNQSSYSTNDIRGVKHITYTKANFKYRIWDAISNEKFMNKIKAANFFLIDESGFTNKSVDITLPESGQITDIDMLKQVLSIYDLDIVKKKRSMEIIVARELCY